MCDDRTHKESMEHLLNAEANLNSYSRVQASWAHEDS